MSEADSEVAKRCKRIDVPFNRILQGSNLAALETTRHAPFFLILCDPPSKRATSKRILDTFSRSGPKSRNEAEANVAASHLTTVVNVWFREVVRNRSKETPSGKQAQGKTTIQSCMQSLDVFRIQPPKAKFRAIASVSRRRS